MKDSTPGVKRPRGRAARTARPSPAAPTAFFGALLLLGLACAPAEEPWTLARGLRGARAYEIEVRAPRRADLLRAARDLAARVRRELRLPVSVASRPAGGDAPAARPRVARLLLALSSGAPPLPPGTRAGDGELFAFGQRLAGDADALVATFEDPARPGLPVTVVVANRVELLIVLARRVLPADVPGLSAWRDGVPWRRVRLDRDGRPRGSPWTSTWRPATAGPAASSGGGVATRAAEAAARAAAWLGTPSPAPELVLLDTPLDLVRAVGEERPWFVAADARRAFAPRAPADLAAGDAALAEATARRAAGPPRLGWLPRAVGVAAAGRWYGRDLRAWVAHLLRADLGLSTAELAGGAALPWSDHRLVPLRAALVHWILARRGAEGLRGLWLGTARLEAGSELDRVFAAWLEDWARPSDGGGSPGADRPPVPGPPWRGAALVADPRAEEGGYLAGEIHAGLAALAEAGAGAFGLHVFPSLAGVRRPFADRLPGAPFGSSSDLALIAALGDGRSRGLAPILSVEPLDHPGGRRAGGGDLAGLGEEAFQPVFDALERVSRHYALLAELSGVEVLVLGAELDFLARTTWEADTPAASARRAKLERWRALLAGVRRAFGGRLTYAARGPRTIWETAFWEELDFVGAHLFPRFPADAGGARGPQRDLLAAHWRRRLGDLARLARDRGRPLFVTQIGFPRSAGGAADARVSGGPPDPELQRRALAALGDALESLGDDAPAGLCLWRLPWPGETLEGSSGHGVSPAEPEVTRLLTGP